MHCEYNIEVELNDLKIYEITFEFLLTGKIDKVGSLTYEELILLITYIDFFQYDKLFDYLETEFDSLIYFSIKNHNVEKLKYVLENIQNNLDIDENTNLLEIAIRTQRRQHDYEIIYTFVENDEFFEKVDLNQLLLDNVLLDYEVLLYYDETDDEIISYLINSTYLKKKEFASFEVLINTVDRNMIKSTKMILDFNPNKFKQIDEYFKRVISTGNIDMVKLFLKYDIDIGYDNDGALRKAIELQLSEITLLLLDDKRTLSYIS